MSLLATVKADALAFRKQRATKSASALTTLIGELETFAKNAGREATDADVVAFVQKTIKNINETLKVLDGKDDARAIDLAFERTLFEQYLPKQLSAEELNEVINALIAAGHNSVGDVMKTLKTKYNGQYDGALASAILKSRF
jgi:uncharacterized protein YqeY